MLSFRHLMLLVLSLAVGLGSWALSSILDLNITNTRDVHSSGIFVNQPHSESLNSSQILVSNQLSDSIKLRGVMVLNGANIKNQATFEFILDQPHFSTFKEGDHVQDHWILMKVNDETALLHNEITLKDQTFTIEKISTIKNTSLFSDPRLQLSNQVKPNLNKPDFVDEATWSDMKSKYGL